MMSVQPFSTPPRRLPLRLLLGGLAAACVALLFRPHGWPDGVDVRDLGVRCGASLMVLATALLMALCIGCIVGLRVRRMGARAERLAALLGRALACVPVVALAWGFIAGWIGRLGLPVESLMPEQFPDIQRGWQALLAHRLWEFLAPALILALPFSGEMIHTVIEEGGAVVALDFPLRARGVPAQSRLWRHHLGQLMPLLQVRLQALCLIAPVYLIIIEDVLHIEGWGGWMAQSLRAGESSGIALGLASGGGLLALLCAGLGQTRGRLKAADSRATVVAWQPWLFWALGLLALLPSSLLAWLVLWAAAFMAGAAGWHQAWGRIVAALPLDAARMLGAPEAMIWRHHIAVVQSRMLAAWVCTVSAQTLLGMAAACALQPRLVDGLSGGIARIFRPLAVVSVQDAVQTLSDPAALLWSGAGITLAALCLIQLGRIVQPRLP